MIVDFVSVSLYNDGDAQIITVVRALPPSDSCNIRVSLLSRYGMCDFCICVCALYTYALVLGQTVPSANDEITIPSADNDLLIFFASSSTLPSAPVLDTFSLPAKSTRYSLPASF